MVGIILIGWVALVVIGAGEKSDSSGQFALSHLQDVFVASLALLALCGLVMLPFMFDKQERQFEPRPDRRIRWLIVGTALIVLLAFGVGPQDFAVEPVEEVPLPGEVAVAPEEAAPEMTVDDGRAMLVLFLTCAGAVALLVWSRRRLASALGEAATELPLEFAVGPAIDAATDHLLRGDDPRHSVMAAYAGLERSLAAQGRGRDPHETPAEHLARVLVAVPVLLGPAVQLGELYGLARFSDHEITKDDQRRAAAALDQSRRQLADHLEVAP